MSRIYGSHRSATEYHRIYSDMRGVDFSGDGSGISKNRFSYLENMYRDYDGEGAGLLESFPGYRRVRAFNTGRINGIYSYVADDAKKYIVVHAGTGLYRFDAEKRNATGALSSLISVANRKSSAFCSGTSLFLLDGEHLVRLDGAGNATTVSEAGTAPYVPTTYVNGTEYEQRNLLTDRCREIFTVGSPDAFSYGSPELIYRVSDEGNGTAAVVGIAESATGEVRIPQCITLGDRLYRVTEIADRAFQNNTRVTRVVVSEGVLRIGIFAFANCTSLTEAILPDSVEKIDNAAFSGDGALASLYLGAGLRAFGLSVFSACVSLSSINYALGETEWNAVENKYVTGSVSMNYRTVFVGVKIRLHLSEPMLSVTGVRLDGAETTCATETADGLTVAILLTAANKSTLTGVKITVEGTLPPHSKSANASVKSFFDTAKDYGGSGIDAILHCTVCEAFDGRVFFSGNPDLPNTVFYTARDADGKNDPTYFGICNYFNDGIGRFPTVSLLAAGDSLAVFKSGDDGCGSIYYHTPKETGLDYLPKVYPVSYIHSGICAVGGSISFFDDPVFLTELGLCALNKKAINLERSVVCRSHNVNPKLLTENLAVASMTKWCGYLLIAVGGRVYLADSRATFTHPTGAVEYEWYFLNGLGSYSGHQQVYRYSSETFGDIVPKEDAIDQALEKKPTSSRYVDGALRYYVTENGVKHSTYRTEEYVGGTFSPVCEVYGTDQLLFLGTEAGVLFVLNNDMRGIPPTRISGAADYNAEEYAEIYGRRIHPDYYSFDSHAPRYAAVTARDNCGIPHLSKSTVKHSLVLKCRSYDASKITVEVGTDRSGYREEVTFPGSALSFNELNFSSLVLDDRENETVVFAEKEKRWVEKQISISSQSFCAPIGIYSLAYRFVVEGKLKQT